LTLHVTSKGKSNKHLSKLVDSNIATLDNDNDTHVDHSYLCITNTSIDSACYDTTVTLYVPSTTTHVSRKSLISTCMFDNGSLQDNFGSIKLGQRLAKAGAIGCICHDIVCSVFGECKTCLHQYFCFMQFVVLDKYVTIPINIKFYLSNHSNL
jgi:hypothetical protein